MMESILKYPSQGNCAHLINTDKLVGLIFELWAKLLNKNIFLYIIWILLNFVRSQVLIIQPFFIFYDIKHSLKWVFSQDVKYIFKNIRQDIRY